MIEDDTTGNVTWKRTMWWCNKCNCYHVGDCMYEKDESITDKLNRIIEILERMERKVKS